MVEKVCGACRWHYAHEAAIERVGWKNCLALPYPDCTVFYSTPTALCSFPTKFDPAPINGTEHAAKYEKPAF